MTPIQEVIAAVKKKADFDFGKWWFINGGQLHGYWKQKKYSAIRDAAMRLPKAAAEHQHAQDAKIIAELLQIIESNLEAFYILSETPGDSMPMQLNRECARVEMHSTLKKLKELGR